MDMSTKFVPLAAIMLAMVAFPGLAQAQPVVWSTTAMTCTPTSTTAEQRKFVTTAGRVKFKDNAFGQISFLCPITRSFPKGKYAIQGAFTHPDATYGKGNSLQLRRANKLTGAVSTILSATIRAEQYPPGKKWGTVMSPPKDITFDMQKYVYWVSFSVSRPTAAGESQAFLGVEIVRF